MDKNNLKQREKTNWKVSTDDGRLLDYDHIVANVGSIEVKFVMPQPDNGFSLNFNLDQAVKIDVDNKIDFGQDGNFNYRIRTQKFTIEIDYGEGKEIGG